MSCEAWERKKQSEPIMAPALLLWGSGVDAIVPRPGTRRPKPRAAVQRLRFTPFPSVPGLCLILVGRLRTYRVGCVATRARTTYSAEHSEFTLDLLLFPFQRTYKPDCRDQVSIHPDISCSDSAAGDSHAGIHTDVPLITY